ncbi:MAG TPA: hypothetical protein VK183_04990, partial [Flavobacterium sp.]|nr:hypothetical protein [Flavobacterium sp.]
LTNQEGLQAKMVDVWTIRHEEYQYKKNGKKFFKRIVAERKMEFRADGTAVVDNGSNVELFKWSLHDRTLTLEYEGNSKLFRLWARDYTVTLTERYNTKAVELQNPLVSISLFD